MHKSIGIAIEMTALVKVIVVKGIILQLYRNYGNNCRNKKAIVIVVLIAGPLYRVLHAG